MRLGLLIVLTVLGNLALSLFARFIVVTIFTEVSDRAVNVGTVLLFVYLTGVSAWIIYHAGRMRAG